MRKLILLILLFAMSVPLNAQITGTVSGTVNHKNTQEELVGVTLELQGADTIYTISDQQGEFNLSVPVGKYNLYATYSGYEALTLFNLNVTSGNALLLQLVRAPIKLTISGRSKLTTSFAGEDFQFMYDGAIQN